MASFTPPSRERAPRTELGHPGNKLMRHFQSVPRAVNVYLLTSGACVEDLPSNGSNDPWLLVQRAFYGGRTYEVTAAEASALTTAGYVVT